MSENQSDFESSSTRRGRTSEFRDKADSRAKSEIIGDWSRQLARAGFQSRRRKRDARFEVANLSSNLTCLESRLINSLIGSR